MRQAPFRLRESPSQTAGPYVHIGCTPDVVGLNQVFETYLGPNLASDTAKGERIRITGRVLDGLNTPVRDGIVEIWQADHAGFFNSPDETRGDADPGFFGWGRSPTDLETGEFSFDTIKPGRVPYLDGRLQAPYIHLWVAARGVNLGLHTRMYFPDEAEANSEDPILNRIELKRRIPTLIADCGDGAYLFDIRLQGDRETIFFDI